MRERREQGHDTKRTEGKEGTAERYEMASEGLNKGRRFQSLVSSLSAVSLSLPVPFASHSLRSLITHSTHRVALLRGPSALRYAVMGVVRVVTRQPLTSTESIS